MRGGILRISCEPKASLILSVAEAMRQIGGVYGGRAINQRFPKVIVPQRRLLGAQAPAGVVMDNLYLTLGSVCVLYLE
jgi:hypothetical protein